MKIKKERPTEDIADQGICIEPGNHAAQDNRFFPRKHEEVAGCTIHHQHDETQNLSVDDVLKSGFPCGAS